MFFASAILSASINAYTVWRETLEGANFGGMARKASLAE